MKNLFNLICILLSLGCSSTPSLTMNELELKNEPASVKREKADLYYSIAQSMEENEMVERAIENYQEALKILPKHAESHFSLGKLLLKRGFKKEGLKEIHYSIKINSRYTEAQTFLARYYMRSAKTYKTSKKLIDQAVKDITYENQEEVWSLKLSIDLKVGGKSLAAESAVKASSIPALNCGNRLSIATSFYKMGLLNPALHSARKADSLCTETANSNRVTYLKGLIFIKKRNLFVAEKIFNGIETSDSKLKSKLTKAQIFVRKQIKSGM